MKKWQEYEINWLIENYKDVGKTAASIYLGRPEASIRQKCYRLKLTQNRESEFFKEWQSRAAHSKIGKKRPEQAAVLKRTHAEGKLIKNDDQKEAISKRVKEWMFTNGHPKGFKGKKHTETAKELMANASIRNWANPDFKLNQDEHRQKLSDNMMKSQKKGILRSGYSRGLQGKREDLGNIFFRSSWEANYARYLNFLIAQGHLYKWEFEPDTFWFESIKRGVRSYLPDFKLWDSRDSDPYYIEVKGWMDGKSKTKLSRMAKYYPDIKLILVGQKEYNSIKRRVSGVIKNWE